MKNNIVICKDHQAASLYAAGLIAESFIKKPEMTVTFAAGDTPFACYHQLTQRQEKGELRLDRALYIGLDEWVGLGADTAGSCIGSMMEGYYHPAGIPNERILAFDGLAVSPDGELERMREILRQHTLELAVLGVGVNGHVGFNEPGAITSGDFSFVPLSESTQLVGRKYFSGEETPTQGATITLQALKKAKQVLILATGASKRDAVRAIVDGSTQLPVCAFLDHPGVCYIFDEASVDVTV